MNKKPSKQRADKGIKRGRQSKPCLTRSNMWKYKMVLSKVLKKHSTYCDPNGYYYPIEEKFKVVYGDFGQRTQKHIRTQKYINLEEYRFNAWLEMAQEHPYVIVPLPQPDLNRWALECANFSPSEANEYFKTRNFNWLNLFCSFYHIKSSDIALWDFPLWYSHYVRVPSGEELDEDFKFSPNTPPGSPDFHPEWLYKIIEMETNKVNLKKEEHDRRVWSAKISKKHNKICY